MLRITKANHYIICLFFVFVISSLIFADNQNTFLDYISNKIIKETKEESDRNKHAILGFSNVQGRKLISALKPDYIERICIPYKTDINPEQISYLFKNAVFKEYDELPATHLLPTGTFQVILKNYLCLVFHTYMDAPMMRVTWGIDEYWLEIPYPKTFYTLGRNNETTR